MISRGGDYRESKPVSIGEPDKVQSWPFKEPEKTTAWKPEDITPKDVPVAMVDSAYEAAVRRTAEIKKQMSPPGALGLPELLEAQRLKWGIPDGAFECRAVFDRIHIFPIDFEGQKETWGSSGIIRPETTKERDIQNGHRGILISMGLTAADHCVSHGIELGHIVRTIRNAPHAQECARVLGKPMWYLVMRDGDLTGSETLEADLRAGRATIVDDGGEHSYCHNLGGRKKRSALVADNW
jgi:hypothetical protein